MVLSELLAPAGSYDVLVVAINAGADAVYIAGHRYGARAFAHNFTSEELEAAVRYAHLNGSAVHVTVNTLFNTSEILNVLKYAQFLYRIGVDALIVQDLGLVYLLRTFIPDMEIHSSTQMTLRDYNSVLWAKDNGIKRVILPREMGVEEINCIHEKLIADNINIDLEVFGHGSLCYCISGDCYMSSFIVGRSANRGACAQPCRSQYKLKYHNHSVGNGCLISTHDLAVFRDLKSISDAGVYSLKIEGRLKSDDYVSTVVNTYRTMIDHLDEDDNGDLLKSLQRDLDLTFNRYYTNGYILNDEPWEVMGRESSFHQGLYLGKIVSIDGELVDIEFADPEHPHLINGDGIGFKWHNKIRGIYLDSILEQDEHHVLIETTRDIRVGSEVYISYSKALHDKQKQYKNEQVKPHVPLSLDITCNKKNKLVVNASFNLEGETIQFGYRSTDAFEKAINKPITSETIEKQMSKTGNTSFIIENIKITNFPNDLFMPIGKLNQIRRELLNKASEKLLNYYIPNETDAENIRLKIKEYEKELKEYPYKTQTKDYVGMNIYVNDFNLLKAACKHPVNKIYFDPSFFYKTSEEYFENIESLLRNAAGICYDKELVWVLSAFTSDKELILAKNILENLTKEDIIISVMGDSPSLTRIFDCNVYGAHNINVWNNYTVKILSDSGFKGLTISSELSKQEICEMVKNSQENNCNLELIVFGNQEIMVTNDDFGEMTKIKDLDLTPGEYMVLEDKKKNKAKFKIFQDYNNRSHFFNDDCLSLIDELDELKELGIDEITLDCRFTTPQYMNKVITLYQEKLNDDSDTLYFESIEGMSNSTINKGNYINGRALENIKRKNN